MDNEVDGPLRVDSLLGDQQPLKSHKRSHKRLVSVAQVKEGEEEEEKEKGRSSVKNCALESKRSDQTAIQLAPMSLSIPSPRRVIKSSMTVAPALSY